MRRPPFAIGIAIALALGAIGGSPPAIARPRTRPRPRLAERQILRIAETAAAGAGDRRPMLIQHSAASRRRANLIVSGDGVTGAAWSYLIAERGHFVLDDVSVPPGAHAPHGSVLTLVVDASTREVTDLGVSDRYPKLAALGPVTTDLRRAHARPLR